MRKLNNIRTFELCNLHNEDWLISQRIAGKCVSEALNYLKDAVKNRTKLTTRELSIEAEKIILSKGCQPTFKGYKGFPEAVCISVNCELVHGIPSDYAFNEGDVISFDLGATYNGTIADAAITCIYGEPRSSEHIKLINITNECLNYAISSIKVGKKIGCIGEAIYKRAKNNGFGVVVNYGGHGLDYNILHSTPFISNRDSKDNGFRIQSGLVLCIEPMLVLNADNSTRVGEDGWTVYTRDIGAHVEKTIFVHEGYVEIITENL
jgi:methionyl aminopeptidase